MWTRQAEADVRSSGSPADLQLSMPQDDPYHRIWSGSVSAVEGRGSGATVPLISPVGHRSQIACLGGSSPCAELPDRRERHAIRVGILYLRRAPRRRPNRVILSM